jgi:hypothetical protein
MYNGLIGPFLILFVIAFGYRQEIEQTILLTNSRLPNFQ